MTVHRDGTQDVDEVADCLAEALFAIETVDYNTLTESELEELLEARQTVEALCRDYRQAKPRQHDDG